MKNHLLLLFYLVLLCFNFSCDSKTQLSEEEQLYLSNNPEITVGIYIYYPPYEFINENGQVSGILIEYFNKLENNIGHTFKKKYYNSWQQLLNDVKTNKVNIVLEIQDTKERRKYLNFTEPVFLGRHIILTKNDSQDKKVTDLYGKKVCLCESYSVEEYIRNKHPDIIRVLKPDEQACINALSNNEVDAFIGIESAINYFLTKEGQSNLKIQSALKYNSKLSFAVNIDKPILASIIKKGNSSITLEEKNEILNKWLYDVTKSFDQKLPFWRNIFAAIAILFILSFLASLYLKKEVRRRTKELIKAKQVAEKNSALKTLFFQNISHEIRTPLNSIVGFTSFLKEEKNEEIRYGYINTILKESSNLTNIINNVIEISELTSKKTKPEIQTVDLHRELNLLKEIYKVKAVSKGLNFSFNITIKPNEKCVLCDKTRLNKSISNILDNAIKFTKKGSVTLNAEIENNILIIKIKDTGIGIDTSKLKSIFSEFYQEEKELSKKYDGLGIGLSIANKNIKSMGGIITPTTSKGEGSIFTIELPVEFSFHNCDSEVIEIDHQLKILIAEDMKLNYLVLQKILQKIVLNDTYITWAKDGQEAVDFVNKSHFDIIFMDIKMPVLNGYEATKIIKDIRPKTIVIAQTSYALEQDMNIARSIGFDAYITKPIDPNALKTILQDFFVIKTPSNF